MLSSTVSPEAAGVATTPSAAFVDYFGCPAEYARFDAPIQLSSKPGYFRFGDALAFGRRRGSGIPSATVDAAEDITGSISAAAGSIQLPFDLAEVVDNLRLERYFGNAFGSTRITETGLSKKLYYLIRPLLPVSVRKYLQRVRLSDWQRIPFPRWPVDASVESLMRRTMHAALTHSPHKEIPFIWFWPEGAECATIVTHDIEALAGRDFCGELMDMNDAYGIKASFQVVPEVRYAVPDGFIERIRRRGFEVNVHDLNHDGRLFVDRTQFLERARRINGYARKFASRGFRAGAMYRRQDWFGAFEFSYDMSVPNVAHLEPQRGGCATVLPYFIGDIVELPLTTIQDYSLFHILNDYSIDLWRQQIELIRAQHGLITFITHPDYLIESRARAVYLRLLEHLRALREAGGTWFALPGEVNRWWRERQAMALVRCGHEWSVQGPGSARARVAYATLDGDQVVYRLNHAS